MLTNYLKLAWRNLRRNRSFSTINIVGLGLGIATFLLIAEFVAYEWSANRFQQQYDQLYRVMLTDVTAGPDSHVAPGLAKPIREQIGGVRHVVRLVEGIGNGVLTTIGATPTSFREESIVYADADFFRAFTFPFVAGGNTLEQPQTVAMSATLARKLFGSANPIGQQLNVSNQFGTTPYTLTGVFADMPVNSDIQTQVVLALTTLNTAANRNGNDWADPATFDSDFISLFLQLDPTTNPATAESQLTQLFHQRKPDQKNQSLRLQPFRELHLAPSFNYPYPTFGSLPLVTALAGIALLVLLIAWINYINLSTAQALRKAKEVGVRKVIGAQGGQLVSQFLTETLLLSTLSVGAGLLLTAVLQTLFNTFTGKDLSLTVLAQSGLWVGIVGIVALTALVSGGYVALVMSTFSPITALRRRAPVGPARLLSLRQGLVVFQFGISVLFIIATLVMFRQLQFMQSSPSGMSLSQRLIITGPTLTTDDQNTRNAHFKQELARLPFVQQVAGSNNVPGVGYNFGSAGITRPNPTPGDEKKNYRMFIADQNFFSVYDIRFAQGRPFTSAEAEATWNNLPRLIVNERAARQLGYDPKQPVTGQKVLWGREFEIVGMVNDYHHLSMQQAIEPVIYLASGANGYFTVKTDTRDMTAKLARIETLYKQTFPGNPFDYDFADAVYSRQFQTENRLGQVFIAASLIAILIACLGIFGLAAFAAQQRTKEIGVRKVLGASVTSIVTLLSKDFLKLVLVAIVVASPLAWYAMNKWLQDFAYRVDISWWVFGLAGLLAVGIALLTVSFQSVKAALVNPVKSLRSE
jgi:putative ABC transport system permease protein